MAGEDGTGTTERCTSIPLVSDLVAARSGDESDTGPGDVESPLFTLPPEIRNRIYSHLLSRGTIHVRRRKAQKHFKNVSRRTRTPSRMIVFGNCHSGDMEPSGMWERELSLFAHMIPCPALCTGYSCRPRKTHPDAAISHAATAQSPGSPRIDQQKPVSQVYKQTSAKRLHGSHKRVCVDGAILQTCRCIYSESSLIPFSENTFTFESGSTFKMFCERLPDHQLRAVRRIVFAASWTADAIDPADILRLVKLDSLSVYILDTLLDSQKSSEPDGYLDAVYVERGIRHFASLPVVRAHVHACFDPWAEGRQRYTIDSVRRWAERLEAKLTGVVIE